MNFRKFVNPRLIFTENFKPMVDNSRIWQNTTEEMDRIKQKRSV